MSPPRTSNRLERSAAAMDSHLNFLAVSVVGFIVDLTLAAVLRYTFGIRLSLAAIVSFTTVGIANYALHEFFTFAKPAARLSAPRLILTLSASALALACRITVIEGGAFLWAGPVAECAWLIIGSGVSLSVNFLLLQKVVFK